MSESSGISTETKSRFHFKLKVPHTWVLMFILIIIAAILTYIIPAGVYDHVTVDGRELVDPKTFHYVDAQHAGIMEILKAFPNGLVEAASIVFFIFIVGGSFAVVQSSGAIDSGIAALVKRTSNKTSVVIPILCIIFAFGGGIYGMAEETLPFIPALVALSISLGYDSITGVAIALAATCAGFTGAFLNPFTIGVAQGIAGVPLFSGLGFRVIVFITTTLITIAYMMIYCRKIKKNPKKSVMYEIDSQREDKIDLSEHTSFSTKHKVILLTVLATFVILVIGVLKFKWYIIEISGLFLGMMIIVGLINGWSSAKIADEFIAGCASLTYGAMVVGLARGVLVIFTDANVIDTIIHGLAAAIQGLSSNVTALGIYFVQIIISAIVPSGSGMAALTMPVLSPLADITGVTRQTAVLAYQFADGFTNILTPLSGYFMAGLALAKVPYQKWVKWIMPLAIIWWVVGGIFVVIANIIHFGPF